MDGGDGVGQYGEESTQEDKEVRWLFPDIQADDGYGNPGNGWNRANELQNESQGVLDLVHHSNCDAHNYPRTGRDGKSDKYPEKTGTYVGPEIPFSLRVD